MIKHIIYNKIQLFLETGRKCRANLTFFLCSVLLLSAPMTVLAEEGGSSYQEYKAGAAGAVYPENLEGYTVIKVTSESDLVKLAADCELDAWSRDKYVKLEEDIVLVEHRNLMIPSFGGIFDGGGHQISQLEIEEAGSAVGLFRYIQEGGVVRSLEVLGRVHPEGSKGRAGLLVGVNYGSILDCKVSGSVSGQEEIGGLAGVNGKSGQIGGCSSRAVVTGSRSTGGICGSNLGTLNHCENSGSINIHAQETFYDIEDLTVDMLEEGTADIGAYMDTGGIAGYCAGKIYYCTNTGTVGYPHVGYNTGGIAGRLHQGYVQNCTNMGHILGRKDVGGIVGQMEPFLEIQYLGDKLAEIDREAEKLLDLMEHAHEDLSSYGSQASALSKALTANLRNVNTAAGNLSTITTDLWYVYNQELTGIGNDLKQLGRDLEGQGNADKEGGNLKDITVSGGDMTGDITIQMPDDLESYRAALRRFGDSTGGHVTNMTSATHDRSGGIKGNLETLNRELEAAGDHLDQLASVLEQGSDKTTANVDTVFAQAKVLRKSIRELRDDLFRYEGITLWDASDEKAGVGTEEPGSGVSGADLGSTQASAATGSTGASDTASGGTQAPDVPSEDTVSYADATPVYYDTDSFQQGKVTRCANRGWIQADTNVGGIVGQVATEYDFDPEEDLTVTGAESFRMEQTVKAVIRESINQGDVTGKKDCAGGIVGKADHGAVISCESYGAVSSTGGSFVGGIAGSSSYCVRSCYQLGPVSGKDYIGGIVGKGSDIFYSYACPSLEVTGECAGSIAGTLEEEGVLYGNYYVQGHVAGVDAIGYEGGAMPLPYLDFCSREGVPEAFSTFTVVFQADGEELATFSCQYGDSLEESLIPRIPEKEGFYGYWPEFDSSFVTGSRILEAQYEKWVSSLSGGTGENGRPEVLVQGAFLPGMELKVTELAEGTKLEIVSGEPYTDVLKVRVLCKEEADTEQTVVMLYQADGTYVETPAAIMGSYVEFAMEEGGIFRLTEKEDTSTMRIAIGAGIVILAGAGIMIGKRIYKHRQKRQGT